MANGAMVEFCQRRICNEERPNTNSEESEARSATTLSALKSIFMLFSADEYTVCVVSVAGS